MRTPRNSCILITGGAGFIGTNAALFFTRRGWEVTILDDLSRRGAAQNLEWVRNRSNCAFVKADISCREAVEHCFTEHGPFTAILHLAAQVAVTTSVHDPRRDFEVNALGTLNLLEAARRMSGDAVFLFASTNKVYGSLGDLDVVLEGQRYRYATEEHGVSESRALDFHSPYGCSKGAADQYVLDYARIYGLPAVSFRQSCIYGARQFGIEDQGWVAWFAIAAALGLPITIYGDGNQVRDVLHVDDLLNAYEAAFQSPEAVAGRAFNIGGGARNSLSLRELIILLEELTSRQIAVRFADWRPGDQKIYVSDIRLANALLNWQPAVEPQAGVRSLYNWVSSNLELIRSVLSR